MPTRMTLKQTQMNQVHDLVLGAELEPRDFVWCEEESSYAPTADLVSVLRHRPTGGFFKFDHFAGTYMPEERPFICKLSPGVHLGTEEAFFHSREEQLVYAARWLQLLKAEMDAPDLWGALRGDALELAITGSPTEDNSPFTPEEREVRRGWNADARRYLVESDAVNPKLLETINRRFDNIDDALDRLGRFDWKNFAIAELLKLGLEAMLPTTPVGWIVGITLRMLLLGSGQPSVIV